MASVDHDTNTGVREISVTRLVNATRDHVFDAFTDRAHISNWWGPHGFTTTTHEMDVRPGGVWRFIMHGPDGADYVNKITYREVVRSERLIYDHEGEEDIADQKFQASMTLTKEGSNTRITLRMLFATPKQREDMVKFGAVEGGDQTLERLAAHLA